MDIILIAGKLSVRLVDSSLGVREELSATNRPEFLLHHQHHSLDWINL